MNAPLNRRRFIAGSAATAGLLLTQRSFARAQRKLSPNEKLNLGVIGVAGRGGENLDGVKHQNIVALCDVDEGRLNGAAAKFPGAAKFSDYRKLIDHPDLDGIVGIFQALLRISEIEAGSRRASFARVEISPLLRDVAELYDAIAEERQVTLTQDIPDGITLFGDRALIQQAVAKVLAPAEMKERLLAVGAEGVGSTPEEFAAFGRSEYAKFERLVREAGMKPE